MSATQCVWSYAVGEGSRHFAGEPLAHWAQTGAADAPTTIFMLLHVAERVQLLHAAGFAHRTLSPQTVLWLARQNAWCLGNVSSIAQIGVLPILA